MSHTPVLGKRKRARVSYAEPDVDDFDDEFDEELGLEMSDDDTIYGSRKTRKTTKKRAKLTLTTRKPKKARAQKHFPFLFLPAELRDYIYELALTEKDGVTLVSATKAYRRTVCRGKIAQTPRFSYRSGNRGGGQELLPAHENTLSPNLLAVNKQIHAEGLAWLYQQPLYLEDTMALHTFIAGIGPKNRTVLTNITIEGWGRGGAHKTMNVAAMAALADCVNLKTLHLDCDVQAYRNARGVARQLYRDGHHFFERYGAANGRKDAIVDVLVVGDGEFDTSSFGYSRRNDAGTAEERKKQFQGELRKLLKC